MKLGNWNDTTTNKHSFSKCIFQVYSNILDTLIEVYSVKYNDKNFISWLENTIS